MARTTGSSLMIKNKSRHFVPATTINFGMFTAENLFLDINEALNGKYDSSLAKRYTPFAILTESDVSSLKGKTFRRIGGERGEYIVTATDSTESLHFLTLKHIATQVSFIIKMSRFTATQTEISAMIRASEKSMDNDIKKAFWYELRKQQILSIQGYSNIILPTVKVSERSGFAVYPVPETGMEVINSNFAEYKSLRKKALQAGIKDVSVTNVGLYKSKLVIINY